MTITISEPFPLARALAERLRASRDELTRRWVDRITARVSLNARHLFPTADALEAMSLLVLGVADYIENPAHVITADTQVIARSIELGELRYQQGFDAHEILKEYELLGGVLYAFMVASVDTIAEPCERGELLVCGHRLFRALAMLQQATTMQYLRLVGERIHEREDRLRTFNSTVTHELKNRLNAVVGASQMLEGRPSDSEARDRFVEIIARNGREMQGRLEELLQLSRLDDDTRRQRHVTLPHAVAEVARQLRESIAATAVHLRVADDIPAVEVNAAAVELCLRNYITNAMKYADVSRPEQWVEVTATIEEKPGAPCEVVVRVSDNGLGVPEGARERLFDRFFRAREHTADVEGTGLGLSIVRETIGAFGGRAWAEFPQYGTVFAFSLPCRRRTDLVHGLYGGSR